MSATQDVPGGETRSRRRWGALVILALVVAAVGGGVYLSWGSSSSSVPLSQVLSQAAQHHVRDADIGSSSVTVKLADGRSLTAALAAGNQEQETHLANTLAASGATVEMVNPNPVVAWLVWWLRSYGMPVLIAAAVVVAVTQAPKVNASMAMQGKVLRKAPSARFEDVRGQEHNLEPIRQIVDFLKDPSRFEQEGVQIPRGVLLIGPPGTGKTLLARATAGEAGVPFINLSGGDFVGGIVSEGTQRVKTAFRKARSAAAGGPAIMLIDEIDAVGLTRGQGGHNEYAVTLSAMLVELDGFMNQNKYVIVFAATNRPDELDDALTRKGRLTLHLSVGLPDTEGREEILALHARQLTHVSAGVSFANLAKITAGMSGADLRDLANEAGLAMLRDGDEASEVTMTHFRDALQAAVLGRACRSRHVHQSDREHAAAHEAGHTLQALIAQHGPRAHLATIVPHGDAAGATWLLDPDHSHQSREEVLARIAVDVAGRVAETILLGGRFSVAGARHDSEGATDLALRAICEYQLGPLAGHVEYEKWTEHPLAGQIWAETDDMVRKAQKEVKEALEGKRPLLEALYQQLLARDTLTEAELHQLLRDHGEAVPQISA